jgi:hypothetical protein
MGYEGDFEVVARLAEFNNSLPDLRSYDWASDGLNHALTPPRPNDPPHPICDEVDRNKPHYFIGLAPNDVIP